MSTLSPASQAFVDAYSASDETAPWFNSLKQGALDHFSKAGLPTVRNEAWKYTSLQLLDRTEWADPTESGDAGELNWLMGDDAHRLVFVNGRFKAALSTIGDLPEGAFIGSLADALGAKGEVLEAHLGRVAGTAGNPLVALNAAHMEDGFVILLDNVQLAKSIEIIHVGRPDGQAIAYHPRNLIVADQLSGVTLLEQFTGADDQAYFSNGATEVVINGQSSVNHHRLFADGGDALGVASTAVRVGKDSRYASLVLSEGGQLLRNDLTIRLDAAGAETKLGGIYMADGGQHVDHTTLIEHAEPNTTSHQVFKGALNGKARGVFQGNIVVREGADGSDGQLSNRTVLLSPTTEINSKPQLEIYADDVKCAHGSTVGDLDEESLFYLRTRGIPEVQAKAMLVEGFLAEVIDGFDAGGLEDIFRARIAAWMGAD